MNFVIGLDPSLDEFGYAILDIRNKNPKIAEYGVIKGRNATWGNTPHQVKLALIESKILELIAKYQPLHNKVFFERGFTKMNNSTQATFMARGVAKAKFVGYEIIEIAPNTIKKFVHGHGHASKEMVEQGIREKLDISDDIKFSSDGETDALSIAYTGWMQYIKSI